MAQLRRVWSGRAEDAEHRSNVLRKIRAQSMEFSELNVEYGYAYASAAVVAAGSPPPEPIDDIRVYAPSTRPGAPLPHAWIDDEDGNRCAIKDLVKPGRFLLIAGENGEAWCEAARQLAREAGLPLGALRIGQFDGDLYDTRSAWLRHRQIESDGAILVRPDRFIAWRHATSAEDPRAALADALRRSSAARPTAQPPGRDHGRRALDRPGAVGDGLPDHRHDEAHAAARQDGRRTDGVRGRCHRRPIRTIGLLEVLGAIGLILPAALGVGPILMPLPALGLALTMVGAIATHVRLGEINRLAPAIVLLALALFVAIELF